MKLTCPKDASHKVFEVSGRVVETWVVDEEGTILDSFGADSKDRLEVDDVYTCRACHSQAKAEQ